MRERVAADDRLVRLDGIAGETGDEPRGARDLAGDDARLQADVRLPRVQQHHDLLERRVSGALADPVDRALDLARPGLKAGERVRDREPQVVVAVDGEDDVLEPGDELVELLEIRRELERHRVADRVGDVDRGRALVDRDLTDLGGERDVRAGRVHRRELDVVDVPLGVRDRRAGLALDVLAGRLQLVLDVDVGGRDERVDPCPRGVLDRVPGGVDVGDMRPREPGDHGSLDPARDLLDRFEVPGRGDREPGLDHVDPQPRELLRDLQLLLGVEADPGRLLAVAQRRVEDQYSVGVLGLNHVVLFLSRTGFFSGWCAATCGRRRAIPPEGGGEEVAGRGRTPSGAEAYQGVALAQGCETFASDV